MDLPNFPWLLAFTSAMCFSGRAGRRDAAAPAAGHVAGQGAGAAAVPVAQLELGKRRWENGGIFGDSYGIMARWDDLWDYLWDYYGIIWGMMKPSAGAGFRWPIHSMLVMSN